MLSFVIPAHDEETLIGATVERAMEVGERLGESFEVLVVDDASSDRTAEVARAAGARVVAVAVRQIAKARNAGAAAANGEWFVFVDADTLVTFEVVEAALAALRDGAVGGGSAVRFDEPVPLYGKLLLSVGLWLSRCFRVAAGCFVFCRRDAFETVQGFDPELFAGEEIAFSRALRRLRRGPFLMLREHVVTSGRKLRTFKAGQIFAMVGRLFFLGRRGVRRREGLDLWYGPRRPDPRS